MPICTSFWAPPTSMELFLYKFRRENQENLKDFLLYAAKDEIVLDSCFQHLELYHGTYRYPISSFYKHFRI